MLTIDGRAAEGGDGTYEVRNPVRPAEVVSRAPAATLAQLDESVAAARRAGPSWASTPLDERVERVLAAAAAVDTATAEQELAVLLTREQGKVLQEATFDVGLPGFAADVFAELAPQALAPHVLEDEMGTTDVECHPWGVVAAVIPFNWPVSLMATKVLPALIVGNTVIVKPPPTCPSATLAAVAAMASVLPAGVLQAVNGPGSEVGQALVDHGGVDMISFTGGVASGRAVAASAARRMVPAVLELGGNDPAIVAPDLKIDEDLAGALVADAFLTSGQVCMAIKRLYVSRHSLSDAVDALVAECQRVVVGDGLADEVTMGPLHTQRGRDFVEGLLAEAEAEGAKIHRCGTLRREDAASGGYLVAPAIVEGASRAARIVREEQFAPALPIVPYEDLDDAVAQANDTEFGLCASVWASDDELAATVARRLDAGTVFVNSHGMFAVDVRAPFGGWKQSGLGRELGAEGLLAYARTRSVTNRAM